ncbi:MAG: iron-containing redox enzyme family protein [Gammaproteobacteria bacterium]|nr:iron-containing redox enzyme family protein [Gammaproteobacteria bacterium]
MRAVYITAAGAYLPGEPVDNERIEDVLGFVDGKPSRLKKRILKSNGIRTRHYALDENGQTTELNEELAAKAVHAALAHRDLTLDDVEMLAAGTTQGDVPIPGFASMVHGRLGGRPMETLSAGGVCCSSMAALASAYRAVATQQRENAVVVGSELVSRSLKGTRFRRETDAPLEDGHLDGLRGSWRDFDADFLRWMLSDGAGSVVLEGKPHAERPSLRIDWIELQSHANEFETCMYTGIAHKDSPRAGNTWLDLATIADADKAELMRIRQDTQLLPQIVRLSVEEYLRLIKRQRIDPEKLDHILCHYSSHFFKGEIVRLLDEANLSIPEEKWFTNLYTKGNTGAASILIMLEEALNGARFKPGEKILLMVPESGRFTVSFALLTCVGPDARPQAQAATESLADAGRPSTPWRAGEISSLPPVARTGAETAEAAAGSPLGEGCELGEDRVVRQLVLDLGLVWADFERMLRATPIIRRIESGQVTVKDYRMLLRNLRQQVMEGARWIARAASNVSIELFPFRSMFITHAGEEHRDFQMLERDYCAVGGSLEEIVNTPKNVGSEALSAFMFHRASQPDPLDLLGAMFVIEGLGRLKAGQWAEALKQQLDLTDEQVSFLHYHGQNDDDHFDRLRAVLTSGIIDDNVARRIVKTAKVVARLYALQLEEMDNT